MNDRLYLTHKPTGKQVRLGSNHGCEWEIHTELLKEAGELLQKESDGSWGTWWGDFALTAESDPTTPEWIESMFNMAPQNEGARRILEKAKELATLIEEHCPDGPGIKGYAEKQVFKCPEKNTTFIRLQESVQWALETIRRNTLAKGEGWCITDTGVKKVAQNTFGGFIDPGPSPVAPEFHDMKDSDLKPI